MADDYKNTLLPAEIVKPQQFTPRCSISREDNEVPETTIIPASDEQIARWSRVRPWVIRIILFLVSISIFILALILVKEGAKPLAPIIRDRFSVDSPASALGFGWLSASMVLSGSPIAATSLAFLDAGVLSPTESFAMIAGSRLGASFIVLLVGFVYILRGQQRQVSLGAGLVSLLVTQTMYIPVLAIGFYLLSRPWIQQWQIKAGANAQFTTRQGIRPNRCQSKPTHANLGAVSNWLCSALL